MIVSLAGHWDVLGASGPSTGLVHDSPEELTSLTAVTSAFVQFLPWLYEHFRQEKVAFSVCVCVPTSATPIIFIDTGQ